MVELIFTILFWLIILGASMFFKLLQDNQRKNEKRNQHKTSSSQKDRRQTEAEKSRRETARRADLAERNRSAASQQERKNQKQPDRKSFLDRVREEYQESYEGPQEKKAPASHSQEFQRTETEQYTQYANNRETSAESSAETDEKNPYLINDPSPAKQLFNKDKLREAIVTKEILDKPLALRKRKH